jgi:predicted RNA-binding protein YlxR (DUF448 family)
MTTANGTAADKEVTETRMKSSARSEQGGVLRRENPGRVRTCAGCGERTGPEMLVRLILGPSGELAVDSGGGAFGRGTHVHPQRSCLEKAVQRGIARSTKGRGRSLALSDAGGAPLTIESLAAAIGQAMDRRVQGLLVSAMRSRRAVFGTESVKGACQRGDAKLIVVACDAAAAADLSEVRRAVAEGWAVGWGTKSLLAALCRGGAAESAAGLAVLAITSDRIAAAVRDAVHVAEATILADSGRKALRSAAPIESRASDPHLDRRLGLSTVERGA